MIYPDHTAARYEYDANGNQVKTIYPDGKPVSRTYDPLNRPLTMTDYDGSTIRYEYNLVGTLKRETHDNGTTTEYAYDERQQVREVQETDVDHNIQRLLSYAYDAKGNLWSETRRGIDVEDRDESVSYSYDKGDKLVRTTVDGKTTGYTYDLAGNLIQEQGPDGTTGYTYDVENRLIAKSGPKGRTSYEYDKAGNLIRQSGPEGIRSFEYNGRGLLSKATNEKGETTEYTYNGLGVRVENLQVRDNANAGHRNALLNKGSLYIPDYMPTLIEDRFSWQRVYETEVHTVVQNDREEVHKDYKVDYTSPTSRDILVEEKGSYTQRYLYDLSGKRIGAEFDYAEGTKAGEAGENPASRIAAEAVEKIYYRTSLIDSSLYAMKADGSVISHMMYDEWGAPQTETRQDMNYAGIDNMNNYTGYTYDEVMEIYFAQARFYDPADKRFIQEDPMKDGSNWYAYCGGNPVTWVDPLGLRKDSSGKNNRNGKEQRQKDRGTLKNKAPVPSGTSAIDDIMKITERSVSVLNTAVDTNKKNQTPSITKVTFPTTVTNPFPPAVTPPTTAPAAITISSQSDSATLKVPEKGREKIVDASVEFGLGFGTSTEIGAVKVEANAKAYYLFESCDMNDTTINIEASAQIGVTEKTKLGAALSSSVDLDGNANPNAFLGLVVAGQSIGINSMSPTTRDTIFPIHLSTYLFVGGGLNLDINLSEIMRRFQYYYD